MKRAALILLLSAQTVLAQVPGNTVPADMTAQQRARAESLYKEVRCPTCVAQAVSESDAVLSQDLRRHIDALVVAGQPDEAILDRISVTYGDDIRLRPRREGRTALLWAAPWVAILLGLAFVLRRRKRA